MHQFRYAKNRNKRIVRMTFRCSHRGEGLTLAARLKARAMDELGCQSLYTHGEVIGMSMLSAQNPGITDFEIARNAEDAEFVRMKFTELLDTEQAKVLIDRMIDTARLIGVKPSDVKWELLDKPATTILSVPTLRVRPRAPFGRTH